MNGTTFPPPASEVAEINRIQYELEYTEGINQRMRVPEKLKVAPTDGDPSSGIMSGFSHPSVAMQVPERIVVAGNTEEVPFARPRDLDLIQATPLEPLSLKTPPRVLTLSERPLDFLDMERVVPPTPQSEEVRSHGRPRRERSMSENASRQNGQMVRNDSVITPSPQQALVCPTVLSSEDGPNIYSARGILSLIQSSTRRAYQQVLDVLDENRRFGISAMDSTFEGTPEDMTVVDAAALRRQIIKLNRRLQLLEEENKERAKREMIMYSITVAFWLLNSWLWFRR
ncbi:mitochondrial fission factor isoform X3 [Protopterus annectens]|uniref:mitochondrial fission factor isoform X3 n=1 Tax=Protopterus annectens TaxID=7888 RepID=UPI001CFB9F02|nr:mitochondrial fission factor isoform X3 [Protopterus annectens]